VLPDGGELQYVALTPRHWGLSEPPHHRVYVIPGSGCNGLGGIATDYFHGLRHGEVVIPHKRHVDASRWQGQQPVCSEAFERADSLTVWAQDAADFIRWHLQHHPPRENQAVGLVGISEGAELLAGLAAVWPHFKLLGLVGSTGLDPLEALSMQAQRVQAPDFATQLKRRAADSSLPDEYVWADRRLAYWRSLVTWRHSQVLLARAEPLWLGFGGQDSSVPPQGLQRFLQRAKQQGRRLCVVLYADAEHGLQRVGGQGPLQHYWALVADALKRKDPMQACPVWARQ
jgi:hypothetical protein